MKNHTTLKKTLLLAAACLFLIGSLAVIPIDLFTIDCPVWLPAALSLASILLLILVFVQFKTKLITKIILPVLIVVLAAVSSLFPFCVPYWNSVFFKSYNGKILNYDEVISFEQAKGDLDEAMGYVKKVHPMFKDGLTPEIEEKYERAVADLKEMETITVNDLRREIQLILHDMYDAHTTTFARYPDDRYVKYGAIRAAQGYSLVSVNGMDEEIKEIAEPYYSYEAKEWISVDVGSLSSLDFYGIPFPVVYVWENAEGEQVADVCAKEDFVPYSEYLSLYNEYAGTDETYVIDTSFVSFTIDEEKSFAVLSLTSCTYNQEYIDTVKQMFTQVKKKNISTIAVDVRGNGGGNSMVANEFIRYLPVDTYYDSGFAMRLGFLTYTYKGAVKNDRYDDLAFTGDVYVLTDHNSFSSAMLFAELIQDNGLGKVVGEFPANATDGYGDVTVFCLKNTGIYMQISTKKWTRIDSSKGRYVEPEYPCASGEVYQTLYGLLG